VDNTSDHDPICMVLYINVALLIDVKRAYTPQPSWNKANINDIENYKSLLRLKLAEIKVPTAAICCSDYCCKNNDHFESINLYVSQLADACLQSAEKTIPFTRRRGERGCIPGWTEQIAPLRDKSMFWHRMWNDCGRPHNGIVADIMRRTRLQYHAAIRTVHRNENDIVNERFVSSIVNNSSRNFWYEARCMRRKCDSNTSSVVDGQTNAGKRDGSLGLVSDHFINACVELSVHTAMLFSTMLVHGFATEDMATCTLIPIPKGKNVNVTDSDNYRCITLSSVFGKIFDLVFLNKFYDYLCTSERQFGFKRHHSTVVVKMGPERTLHFFTK